MITTTPAPGTTAGCGRLMAMGTLFVSGSVYQQRTSGGELQYVLPMVQRDGAGVMIVVGIWLGPAADSFMHLHRAHIKSGTALNITFERIFVHNHELHGVISTASLAPDRWPARVAEEYGRPIVTTTTQPTITTKESTPA